ncbi:uncharacterized protein LOC144548796 [Carex rostrata]
MTDSLAGAISDPATAILSTSSESRVDPISESNPLLHISDSSISGGTDEAPIANTGVSYSAAVLGCAGSPPSKLPPQPDSALSTSLDPPKPSPPVASHQPRSIRSKLDQIRHSSSTSKPICFKCGDSGHRANNCRNVVTCFRCGSLGHRSYHCRAKTGVMLRDSRKMVRSEVMEAALKQPCLTFLPNKAIKDFDDVIKRGIVLKDDLAFGKDFIQSHLVKEFPMKDFAWTPRLLRENMFLIDTPNVQWRARVIAQGQIVLGDVVFQVVTFDFLSHDGGSDPVQVWVNITGFPPKLWRLQEFRRLVESFGGFLIDVDPRSSGHYDFSVLRLKVGVPDVRCIPAAKVLHFVGDAQQHRYYFLTFEIDGWKQGSGSNNFRQRVYWQEKRGRDDMLVLDTGNKVRKVTERKGLGQGIVIGERKYEEVNRKPIEEVKGKGKGVLVDERQVIEDDEDEDLLDSNPFSVLGEERPSGDRTVATIGESSMQITVVPPPVQPEVRHSERLKEKLTGGKEAKGLSKEQKATSQQKGSLTSTKGQKDKAAPGGSKGAKATSSGRGVGWESAGAQGPSAYRWVRHTGG